MFHVREFPNIGRFFAVILILLLAGLAGYEITTQGLNYRLIMTFGALIVGGIALVLGERGIRIGFLGWILMFGLGYRTLTFESTYLAENNSFTILQSKIQIHPLTILIFVLFILVMLQSFVFQKHDTKTILPNILWVFSMFWIWGLLVGLGKGFQFKDMLPDVLNLIIIIPVFITTNFVLKQKRYWKLCLTMLYGIATFIAVMGAIEYLFPQVKSLFPGFITNTDIYIDTVGFARAKFSFWGSPIAIFVCVVTFPFILPLWKWYQGYIARIILIFSTGIIFYGIYIAGYRSMWAVTMLLCVILGVMSKSKKLIGAIILAFCIVYIITPPEAKNRFALFTDSVTGDYNVTLDHSSVSRTHRAQDSLSFALQNPLGSGWTASGWVHSDFIQLAADIGLLGSGIFLFWYLKTLLALIKQYIKTSDTLTLALAGAFLIIGAQFLFEAVYVLTQLIAPIWFIWAIAEIKLHNSSDAILEPELQKRIAA